MEYTYRFRLYPNKEQEVIFSKTFGCARFIYNIMLESKIQNYQRNHKNIRVTPAEYKEQHPFLKEVDSLALANEQLNLEAALRNYLRDKKRFSHPKYKSKHDRQSYTTNNQNGTIRIDNHHLRLPKVGFVRIVDHRLVEGKMKKVTIVRESDGRYYANILTEKNITIFCPNDNRIGIDLGLKKLVVTSDGIKFDNPKPFKKKQKRLVKEQKRLSRKKVGSNNREKQRIKVARCYKKIVNIRKDGIHKISYKLIRENQTIAVEDLDVKGLLKRGTSNLSKSIADASWFELLRQLQYKSKWYGRSFLKIDRYCPTSQMCSVCGLINKDVKNLSVREWVCPVCGTHHDRDVNAAKNILTRAIELYHVNPHNLGQVLPEVTPVESK